MIANWSVEESVQYFDDVAFWTRKEWFPIKDFQKNQGRRGSCNYYSMVMLLERLIKRQYLYDIRLSPELAYANNVDGQDHGSLLSESRRDFEHLGAPPFESRHFEKIKKKDFTAEDYKNAKRFTGIETVRATSWEMLVAAVAMGFPCLIAIHAGRNFMDIGRDGFCGVDRGPGNHAICVDRIYISKSGEIGLENPGSWGTGVHDNGIAYIREAHVEQTIDRHPFWIGTSARLDPQVSIDFNLSLAL